MNKTQARSVILSALVIGVLLGAASPASADHIGFENAEYQVDEAAGHVEVKVVSQCCPPATGEFDYYTADLSAVAGADYRQTSGRLLATSCAPCTIRIPIVGDDLFEGQEQFEVKLTNCRASCFNNNGIRRAVVTVLDDDPKPSSSSASTSRSPEPTARSGGGSAVRPSASTGVNGQPARATTPIAESPPHQDDVAPPAETDDRDHAEAVVRNGERDKADDSSLVLVALGTLLLVVGAGLWLKRRLGRRLT